MLKKDDIYAEDTQEVEISCPKCHINKLIYVPTKIIEESLQLITVSITADHVC